MFRLHRLTLLMAIPYLLNAASVGADASQGLLSFRRLRVSESVSPSHSTPKPLRRLRVSENFAPFHSALKPLRKLRIYKSVSPSHSTLKSLEGIRILSPDALDKLDSATPSFSPLLALPAKETRKPSLRPMQATASCSDDLNECFANDSNAELEACIECVASYFPAGVGCANLGDTCAAADLCPSCGLCGEAIADSLSCSTGCTEPVVCSAGLECAEESQSLTSCLGTINGGNECVGCVIESLPRVPEVCSDVDDEICSGLETCASCGNGQCSNDMINWVNCISGCSNPSCTDSDPNDVGSGEGTGIDNSDDNSDPNDVGGGEVTDPDNGNGDATGDGNGTDELLCQAEQADLVDCFGSAGAATECLSCVEEFWPSNAEFCSDVDDETCSGITSCTSCTLCADQVITFAECVTGCSSFPCRSEETPTVDAEENPITDGDAATPDGNEAEEPVCQAEEADLVECFGSATMAQGCLSCVNGFWPPNPEFCSDIDDETCSGIDSCTSCSSCVGQVIAFAECMTSCSSFPCGSEETPTVDGGEETDETTTVDGSEEPANPDGNNSGEPVCQAEEADLVECFGSATMAQGCLSCVEGFWPSNPESCSDIDDATCSGIDNCTSCSSCVDQVIAFAECVSGCSSFPCGSEESPDVDGGEETDETTTVDGGEEPTDAKDGSTMSPSAEGAEEPADPEDGYDGEFDDDDFFDDEYDDDLDSDAEDGPTASPSVEGVEEPADPEDGYDGDFGDDGGLGGDDDLDDEYDDDLDLDAGNGPTVSPSIEGAEEPAGPADDPTPAETDPQPFVCPTSFDEPIVFQSVGSGNTFMDGNADAPGERAIWGGYPLVDPSRANGQVGSSMGMCTVVSEPGADGNLSHLCREIYKFSDGSTIVIDGEWVTSAAGGRGDYTITGGSGCFAGVSGTVIQNLTPNGAYLDVFVNIEAS